MTQQGENSQHWYAFKVFYNKVFEIDKDIREQGVETYFPKVKVYKLWEDKQKEQLTAEHLCTSQLLFGISQLLIRGRLSGHGGHIVHQVQDQGLHGSGGFLFILSVRQHFHLAAGPRRQTHDG